MGSSLRSLTRWLMIHFLPETLVYPLLRLYRAKRPPTNISSTTDRQLLTVQNEVRLEIYWHPHRVGGLGAGPGAALFVLGDEVLRFDCFGGRSGHYHINPMQIAIKSKPPARFYFPPGSHEDHIERAVFELTRNAPAAIAMNRDPNVRRVRLEGVNLSTAAKDMRRVMYEFLEKHRPDLESIP